MFAVWLDVLLEEFEVVVRVPVDDCDAYIIIPMVLDGGR